MTTSETRRFSKQSAEGRLPALPGITRKTLVHGTNALITDN